MGPTRGVILSADGEGGGAWPLRPLRRELAPVANSPLIALQVRGLRDAGIREIAIASDAALAGAAREAVDEAALGVDLIHIAPPADGGPLGRLLAAESFAGEAPLVVEFAGSLTQHDLHRSVDLLTRKRLGALVVVASACSRAPQLTRLTPADTQSAPLSGFPEASLAGANSFVFSCDIFDAARAALEARDGEPLDLTDAVEVLAETPGRVQAIFPSGWSRRLDGVEDLLELNRLVLQRIRPEPAHAEFAGSRVMGPVVIDETSTIESCVLNGPLAIAARAHIADSYVGPYTAIGTGAKIDGAEIERSVVLPEASISPVGFRIEGSVIGASARVSRELAPPRALQLWIGQDAHVSLG
ncbi:MAG TPA: NDP-sugar synthase [Thermoleophilaceae bacterium]